MTDPRTPIYEAIRAVHGSIPQPLFNDIHFILNKHGVKAAESPSQRETLSISTPAPPAPGSAPTGLKNAEAFFASLRPWAKLTDESVAGFNRLTKAMGADGWPLAWAAYGLATAWWETAKQMQPVEEGYYLGEAAAKRHQRSLRYYPWYGRGDVQLTWERNYRLADSELGLGGRLIADPNLALDPETSARILVWGMRGGKFTTKKLADYLPSQGAATADEFKQARRIINGTDKWTEIAAIAQKMQAALAAGGWA